jgi:hypothetical protein
VKKNYLRDDNSRVVPGVKMIVSKAKTKRSKDEFSMVTSKPYMKIFCQKVK